MSPDESAPEEYSDDNVVSLIVGMIVKKNGQPEKCFANVVLILSSDHSWQGVIAWDEFSSAVRTLKIPPMRKQDAPAGYALGEWTDEDTSRTVAWFAVTHGFEPNRKWVDEAVQVVARKKPIHPVRDYLNGLTWDGTRRLPTFAAVYLGAESTEYNAAVTSRWLISAVARIFETGCQADSALVLEGAQGSGKSSALRILAGDAWYADTGIVVGDKDSYQALRRKWIYEFSELASIRGKEIERVKSFISSRVDTYRPSYGIRTLDFPRQVVFAGSTNEESYLVDPTGARRFWPVRCGTIDLSKLVQDRDQIWAEAKAAYDGGAPRHLDTIDLRRAAWEEAEQRRESDDWQSIIAAWLKSPTIPSGDSTREFVTVDCGIPAYTIALGALSMPKWQVQPWVAKRIGHCMRELGYLRRQIRVGEQREWRYFVTDADLSVTTTGDTGNAID